MNKNIIRIGSLCIFILIMIGLLYLIKSNEGFVDPPAVPTVDPESLTKAKQAVTIATAAVTTATKAVGTSTESSAAKDAFTAATAAVTAANSAVTDTMSALKVALGLQDVAGNPSAADINAKLTALDGFAATAKQTLADAQTAANNKNPAAAKSASDAAAATAAAKKKIYDDLPN